MTREGECVNNINKFVRPIGTNIEKCLHCEEKPMLMTPCNFKLPNDWDEYSWDSNDGNREGSKYCGGYDTFYTGSQMWDLCLDCFKLLLPNDPDDEKARHYSWWYLEEFKRNKYFKKYSSYGILKPVKKKALCLWYSVRPPPGTDEQWFIKRMRKFVDSNSIMKGVYTFEWKYPDKCTDHKQRHSIHFHALLYGVMGKINFHIARQSENWFHLNKKQKFWIYDEEDIKDKLDYIQGKTIDQYKNEEKKLDKLSREELGLANVIEI